MMLIIGSDRIAVEFSGAAARSGQYGCHRDRQHRVRAQPAERWCPVGVTQCGVYEFLLARIDSAHGTGKRAVGGRDRGGDSLAGIPCAAVAQFARLEGAGRRT